MEKKKIKRIQNSLFKASTEIRGNVVLNWQDISLLEYPYYADAYKRAAFSLIKEMSSKCGYSDLEACPIVFLYRHALELYIKGMLILGRWIRSLEKHETVNYLDIFKSHSLVSHMPELKEIVEYEHWEWPPSITYNNKHYSIEDLIADFEKIDRHSFTFRYPTKKKDRASSLNKRFSFNIFDFSEKLERLCCLLSGGCMGLEEHLDSICETISDME